MFSPLIFFREEHFANELAEALSIEDIDRLINWGVEAINQAYEIKEKKLYEEFEVSPKQLDFDIRAFEYNLDELHKALGMKQGFEILETSEGLKFGIFCN